MAAISMETKCGGKNYFVFFSIFFPTAHNKCTMSGLKMSKTVFRPAPHVSINGSHAALANVTSGVPQGSVIGPVLFLLYINAITNQIQSNIRLFADDSIVYREIRSPADHQILCFVSHVLT